MAAISHNPDHAKAAIISGNTLYLSPPHPAHRLPQHWIKSADLIQGSVQQQPELRTEACYNSGIIRGYFFEAAPTPSNSARSSGSGTNDRNPGIQS